MMIGFLYMLLPIFLWPFTQVVVAKISRKVGNINTLMFRQFCIALVGLPIFFYYGISEWETILKFKIPIIEASVFGSLMMLAATKGVTLLPIVASRIVMDATRVILAVVVGYFFLKEHIDMNDIIGMLILAIGFYFFGIKNINVSHLKTKNIPLGIYMWILSGVLFTCNMYFFRIYSQEMPAILAAYIVEIMNGFFILIFALLRGHQKKEMYFTIPKKELVYLIYIAPLLLLAAFGLANANRTLPFFITNMSFVFMLFTSMIYSRFLLHEKIESKQIFPLFFIIVGLLMIMMS